jgi:hypothetical protein
MSGVSLLLTLASLSVVYTWRTGVDQQSEYVLQIEPEVVQALLGNGPGRPPEEIFSDVPADVGPFQRLCITILPKDGTPIRHTAAGEEQFRQLLISAARYASRDRTLIAPDSQPTILWPARSGANPDQINGVTTGWEPDAKGNQQYLVQIDPTVLSALAIGDELYVPIDPAAGRLVRFVVKAGREKLPRVGGQSISIGQAPPVNSPTGRSRYSGLSDAGLAAWGAPSGSDSVRQPSRYNTGFTDSQATDPRGTQLTPPPGYSVPPQAGGQGQPPNYGNTSGSLWPGSTSPGYNPVTAQTTNNFDQYRGSVAPGAEATTPAGYGMQPVASQSPQLPAGSPQYGSQYPETRVAGRSTTPVAAATTAPPNPGVFSPSSAVQPQQDKPWGPLLFVTFALFFSIGGNLYLAYTALEFHSRYRNAIERLRSAARSA